MPLNKFSKPILDLWYVQDHKILCNTSKSEFLEKNALYVAQQRLILTILTLPLPDANSVVHYLMINYPSTITKNLLLIPQVSNHSTFQPFSLHLNSCTVSMEVGDLPFWALLHTLHCASFWLTTIIPLRLPHSTVFFTQSQTFMAPCVY